MHVFMLSDFLFPQFMSVDELMGSSGKNEITQREHNNLCDIKQNVFTVREHTLNFGLRLLAPSDDQGTVQDERGCVW